MPNESEAAEVGHDDESENETPAVVGLLAP
jgi:hypothetical protein